MNEPQRERIDRTTSHRCQGMIEDERYFASQGRTLRTCVNCDQPIRTHFVQFSHICGDCRLECTDDTDVRDERCAWCNEILHAD